MKDQRLIMEVVSACSDCLYCKKKFILWPLFVPKCHHPDGGMLLVSMFRVHKDCPLMTVETKIKEGVINERASCL